MSGRSVLLALAASLLCLAGLPSPKTLWFEARTAHFRCVTDASEAKARSQAQDLELIHAILTVISPDLKGRRIEPSPQFPTTVFLFADHQDFNAYADGSGLEGFSVAHPDGAYLAIATDAPDASEVPIHEYLHTFLNAQFPGVPLWLNEGLACFFQTLERRDLEVQLGKPPRYMLQELGLRGVMPAARLLGDTAFSPDYADTPDRNWFYASAWLLTDYFMTGTEAQRTQLGTYLDLLREGKEPNESRLLAFGRTTSDLDQDLKAYLARLQKSHTILTWTLHFKNLAVDSALTFRPLPRAEALGRLGLLLLGGTRNSQALEHFTAALALAPGSVPGNTGMGLLALQAKAPQDAEGAFARASEGEPEDAVLHFYAAASLYWALPRDPDALPATRTAVLARIRAHLLRAVELGCPVAEALPMLTSVITLNDRPTAEELAALERACKLLPGQFKLKVGLADQYEKAGQPALARSLLEEVAAQTVDPDLARIAGNQLKAREGQDAEHLHQLAMDAFKRKAYDEARAAMKAALALQLGPAQRERFEKDFKDMEVLIGLRTRKH